MKHLCNVCKCPAEADVCEECFTKIVLKEFPGSYLRDDMFFGLEQYTDRQIFECVQVKARIKPAFSNN